jgi:hypothetical protein
MKAPKTLKELPGFDDAMGEALEIRGHSTCSSFSEIPDVVLPGIRRVSTYVVLQLALLIGAEKDETKRRHLRALPPPRLAANDCEATNG